MTSSQDVNHNWYNIFENQLGVNLQIFSHKSLRKFVLQESFPFCRILIYFLTVIIDLLCDSGV